MPIYEYRCKSCDTAYDQLRSIATMDDARACPECGSDETERRLPSRFALPAGAEPPGPVYDKGVRSEYDRVMQQPDPDAMTADDWWHAP